MLSDVITDVEGGGIETCETDTIESVESGGTMVKFTLKRGTSSKESPKLAQLLLIVLYWTEGLTTLTAIQLIVHLSTSTKCLTEPIASWRINPSFEIAEFTFSTPVAYNTLTIYARAQKMEKFFSMTKRLQMCRQHWVALQ